MKQTSGWDGKLTNRLQNLYSSAELKVSRELSSEDGAATRLRRGRHRAAAPPQRRAVLVALQQQQVKLLMKMQSGPHCLNRCSRKSLELTEVWELKMGMISMSRNVVMVTCGRTHCHHVGVPGRGHLLLLLWLLLYSLESRVVQHKINPDLFLLLHRCDLVQLHDFG